MLMQKKQKQQDMLLSNWESNNKIKIKNSYKESKPIGKMMESKIIIIIVKNMHMQECPFGIQSCLCVCFDPKIQS